MSRCPPILIVMSQSGYQIFLLSILLNDNSVVPNDIKSRHPPFQVPNTNQVQVGTELCFLLLVFCDSPVLGRYSSPFRLLITTPQSDFLHVQCFLLRLVLCLSFVRYSLPSHLIAMPQFDLCLNDGIYCDLVPVPTGHISPSIFVSIPVAAWPVRVPIYYRDVSDPVTILLHTLLLPSRVRLTFAILIPSLNPAHIPSCPVPSSFNHPPFGPQQFCLVRPPFICTPTFPVAVTTPISKPVLLPSPLRLTPSTLPPPSVLLSYTDPSVIPSLPKPVCHLLPPSNVDTSQCQSDFHLRQFCRNSIAPSRIILNQPYDACNNHYTVTQPNIMPLSAAGHDHKMINTDKKYATKVGCKVFN
eukprot:g43699.t1